MAGWAAVYRSDFNEAWELAESGLAAGEAGSIDDGSVANLIGVLPTLSRHGQERARDIMDREVTRARTSGQTERLARALAYRVFARRHDDIDGRLADAGEAVALTNTLGNLSLAAFAHSQAAWSLHRAGDPSAAELARETARLASASRNTIMSAYSSHLLGTIAIEQRRYCDAMAHLTDALRTWRRAADARSWGAVHQIAELLTDTGHGEAALTLFAAIGNRNLGVAIYLRPDAIERAAALADHDTATRSRLRGALLDEDGAIEVALAAAAEMIAGSTVSTTPAHLAPTDPCDKPALPAPASDAHKQQPH
jgi:hypothetical protein